MYDEALEQFSQEKECRGGSESVDYLFGVVYSKIGEVEKARQILKELEGRNLKGFGMAKLYFALNEIDSGFKMLEDMYDTHNTWLIYILANHGFDDARSHPRFKNLLKKIGLDK